ncbi:ParB N-terminal domain-containing protein [Stappia sp. ES.058]|uniref:ParB N-terminal domain-containing protein n=1 Tax=Stappia sp. ES.058 TaxID=1881061 RepID=UPI00087C222C|nr:ParB N-terminal domain-containing protein [Stappia sp. ES.058]SDU09151.1 chromosome partitioning protein, ParB family [Stappia sp. ES.058]
MTAHTIMDLDLAAIDSTNRLRKALPARVEALAEDLDQRGLLTPIEAVGPTEEGRYRLIYGAHRLAAASLLGWTKIPAILHAPDAFADAAEIQLREIRENLMRFELNPLERAVAIGAWRDIYEAAHGKVKPGRKAKKADAGISANIARIQPNGDLDDQSAKLAVCFSEAAQAAFGLSQRAIYLALKIATISPDIRDRIADSPLACNQSELLKLADQTPDRQAQIIGLMLAEPPTATTIDDAIAVIDKTQPAQTPKPWEKVSDRFSRLKRTEQHRFFEAHRDAIDLWLAERG